MADTIAAKSDQINSDDLISGPITITVERVDVRKDDQPVDIHTVETPGRAYRPSKGMRRVLVAAWGKESSAYAGRRMTLYRDPDVKWAGEKVGGIKIGALSHIDKPMTIAVTESRGSRKPHTIKVLATADPDPIPPELEPATSEQLKALKVAMDGAGITTVDAVLEFATKAVGREVDNPKALTKAEASSLLDTLNN